MATKAKKPEYNLELARTRALVLSQGRDLTEVTRNSVQRNIVQLRRNPRNGAPDRPTSNRETIAQMREKSRSVVLKAWSASMNDCVSTDRDSSEAYGKASFQMNYRAFFLQTVSGRILLEFVASGRGKHLGLMLVNIANLAHQVVVTIGGKNIVADPIQIYVDIRKELWARVAKTGDFSNLIQKQERLLQRIATTLAFAINDKFACKLTYYEREHLYTFRALFVAHLQQLPQGSVSEIQHTALMLEAILHHCDLAGLWHKMARGAMMNDTVTELNTFQTLSSHIQILQKTTGNFNPDS